MNQTKYSIRLEDINGYKAYYLRIRVVGWFGVKRWKYVPTMFYTMNGVKNKYLKPGKFPSRINKKNFFYFIHATNRDALKKFIRDYPDIDLYLVKLKNYLKSIDHEISLYRI